MIKILGRLAMAAALLGIIAPGLAMAAGQSKGADISGGNMTHGCSPAMMPCK